MWLLANLRVLSGKEVCTILSKHGFSEVRQKGSHIIMQKTIPDSTLFTVPVLNHTEIRSGIPESPEPLRIHPNVRHCY